MTNEDLHDSWYDTAIAIIGMSGRFPGAQNVREFWQNIAAGVKSIRTFSDEELLAAGADAAWLAQPSYVKAGTVLPDVDCFDASFFRFNPREVEVMDPQHRLFLECAWEALEEAAYDPETYQGLVGVFVGSAFSTYLLNNIYTNPEIMEVVGKLQASIGNDRDSLASIVSYKLNLRGPSFAVQTFCSTSLVAVHLACQSLLNYECDMALAGGIALQFPQVSGYFYEEGGILSPDGECRTFDARGQGSVMGNGVGVVTLKRLGEAITDGDHVYAVIRGSATNNDGSVRVSYTAPGLNGQSEVITQAISNADVPVETIQYIEAHGTATMLGDSVELAAMKKAFGRSTRKKQFCAIGSVKPNIGHLDRASGVTGLIKTSLALTHKLMPPSLNFEQASTEIDLDNSPFYVNTRLTPWPTIAATPRRAGVSSFGIGGTNAHVVLEEAPERESSSASRPWQLLLLSAKTATALEAATANLYDYLCQHEELNLADMAYTLQVGRSAFNHRRMVVCQSREDAIKALDMKERQRLATTYQVHRDRPVVFLFPGAESHKEGDSNAGGEQYLHIARALYKQEAFFRETVDQCCEFLRERLDIDLLFFLSPSVAGKTIVDETIAQLLTFVTEYALAHLLMRWGIKPQAMLGYGAGEYVAACLSAALSLEDALTQVGQEALIDGTASSVQGIETLVQGTDQILLEVGAGQSFYSLVKQHPACAQEQIVLCLFPCEQGQSPAFTCLLLETLGQLWLAGATIDWAGFYAGEQRYRLSLPTYPFERERYWLEQPSVQKQREQDHQHKGKKADLADWFYLPRWEKAPVRDVAAFAKNQRSHFLIFMDACGAGDSMAVRLGAEGYSVLRVQSGDRFASIDEQTFSIRPGMSSDYVALCQELTRSGRMPDTVVHCWSVSEEHETLTGVQYFETRQEQGFYSLVYLTQAFGTVMYDKPVQMVVISNHMQAVTGQELLQPEKATILGACKVIPQENLNIVCRSIDLEAAWDGSIIDSLIAECVAHSTDLTVAYRRGERYIQTYQPVRLEAVAPQLRPQGVYLITGGLGGVGPVLATYLAKSVQAKIVLVSRSHLPPETMWGAWLETHDASDAISRKLRQLQAIEEAGSEVLLVQADVADAAQMEAAIRKTYEHFGALHGVIHAAGITTPSAFRAIQDTGKAECETHFRPKVYGLYALEQVLRGYELDFCLLFSSVSAVLGGLGFVAYAAANIFMDAFACNHNRSSRTPWINVNWDTWQVKKDVHGALGATVAEYEMTPEEGTEAFARVLAHNYTHLINSTGDLQARIQQWIRLESLSLADDALPLEISNQGGIRNLASGDYEHTIAEIWKQVLGVKEVGLYDNFFDLGGNSLVALQVMAKLKKAFPVQIPAVALFEAPTVSSLVKYLLPVVEQSATDSQSHLLTRQRSRQQTGQQDIAIIGMTGRFPGASSVEEFWQNLRDGVESITFFTDEELLASGIDPHLLQDPAYVKARPVLADVEHFDAGFFGYSPREAELTDPQHRLFIECCWEALELAGYDPSTYPGLIGVFGGTNISTYLLSLATNPELLASADEYQIVIGNDKDSLTTSISYKFNLKGPSFAVQTFCSTSLVATHLACQSLFYGECDMALAGGVSIRVPAKAGHLYQEGGMESPDGHCRTFDAEAKGCMFGDGVGVVVLKRLADALEDGDSIYAVIKGSAINNDGSLKVSYTAPSVVGQAEVVSKALQASGVPAESIGYVEAHGTATELGDPIEIASLTRAFQTQTSKTGYCAIGSVKTNIGHLDRAAGISGLIKTALALYHGEIPPSLHFHTPNPEIDFEHSPFYVNTRLAPWKTAGAPRRAGINSLGLGGTNVHVVLEQAPTLPVSSPSRPWQLLLLSARTSTALEAITGNLRAYLEQREPVNLADIAYTLQVGRKQFEHRRMLLCRTREEAVQALQQDAVHPLPALVEQRTDRAVAFLFPGLGEELVGMAQELYQQEAIFRQTVDRCCHILQVQLNIDLRELLYPQESASPAPVSARAANGHAAPQAGIDLRAMLNRTNGTGHHPRHGAANTERLKQTALAQPAVFVLEYALAQLLMQWGIRPQAMLGYSLGEYVAACLSGVLSLEDALTLVARRAALIQQTQEGAMIAVALSEDAVQPYLSQQVSLAVIPAPTTCVLAGSFQAIAEVEARLAAQDIASRRVETTHAFHSTMLAHLQSSLTEVVRNMKLHPPHIPYLSNVTGTWITAEQATDPSYWAQHMCQTVRFADGVGHLLQETECVLLEVGPGQSLSSFVKQHPACGSQRMHLVLSTLPSLYERLPDDAYVLNALGKLWLAGVPIEWTGFYTGERRQRLPLPTYPFERQRYWLEAANKKVSAGKSSAKASSAGTPEALLSELKLEALSDWFYLPGWKHTVPPLPSASPTGQDCWLAFVEESAFTTRLIEQLSNRCHHLITIKPGKTFTKESDTAYTIHPSRRTDYEALLGDLRIRGLAPAKVIHLWTVSGGQAGIDQDEQQATIMEKGFYSLLALAQALGDAALDACRIVVVSNDIHNVTGNEQLFPLKATVIGPCKVIPQEYPALTCQSIDITLPEAGSWQEERLLQQLIQELMAEPTDLVVALRGNRRWVQTFEPMPLNEQHTQESRLREGGVYLITGGLGGIGLAMAEYLARATHARLILLSRSGLPPRHEWSAILQAQGDSEGVGLQIRKVQNLESLGSQVLILSADVTDEAQMQAAVQRTLATFGTIHGVLHTAGVPGIGLMQLKTPEAAERVLAPKVQGTLVLERVLRDMQLDFLVLFSSITSTTGGGPGQVDYCAANAFLDAYAQRHFAQHGMTVAINWGEWQWNAWEAGLSGYDMETQAFFKENRRRFGISFEDGAEALRRILSYSLPQVVVSTQDFRALVELSKTYTAATMLEKSRQRHQARTIYSRPTLSSEYAAPGNELERRIATVWEELLGIVGVGMNDNFFELGGNSLIGVDLIARLRKELHLANLPGYVLFEAPTITAMAHYIEQSKTTETIEARHERGERRRESLKHRMHGEARRTP